MDVLRKELDRIYESQHLEAETLDDNVTELCKDRISVAVSVDNSCYVITDVSADRCHVYAGSFARLLGLTDDAEFYREIDSSDEDMIYNRMHPEDLVEKRMLEYEFFKFADKLCGSGKTGYAAKCRIRMKNRDGEYIHVDNSTQILQLSPEGKMWLILCHYDLSSEQSPSFDISPCIVNNETGDIKRLQLAGKRTSILTAREKEILRLIRDGYPSKQIAELSGISINTVNRHRQNILEKLSVGNSMEAVMAAMAMNLL